jgi:hypothetical protein
MVYSDSLWDEILHKKIICCKINISLFIRDAFWAKIHYERFFIPRETKHSVRILPGQKLCLKIKIPKP